MNDDECLYDVIIIGGAAADDVTDTPYKQVIISAAQGATTALFAYNYIKRLRGKPAIKGGWKSLKWGSNSNSNPSTSYSEVGAVDQADNHTSKMRSMRHTCWHKQTRHIHEHPDKCS